MSDDFLRLFIPPIPRTAPRTLPTERAEYEDRARSAAREAAERNELPAGPLEISFPGGRSIAPLRVRGRGRAGRSRSAVRGRARPWRSTPRRPWLRHRGRRRRRRRDADGERWRLFGPLAERQGKTMRPDVAAAFDRMAAAAAPTASRSLINSGFRSDAEQAALFAANPDPRMVAPPGTSLHRCGTELDLGSLRRLRLAGGERFALRLRAALLLGAVALRLHSRARALLGRGRPGRDRAGVGLRRRARGRRQRLRRAWLPGFVPPQFRGMLLEAAAANDVSAALLAAQLTAESNFNLPAVSPRGRRRDRAVHAGDRGGLRALSTLRPGSLDRRPGPADGRPDGPVRRPRLALAAKRRPGAGGGMFVRAPRPETQAYVAKIMAMLDGAGELGAAAPGLEVRLVDWLGPA